jgi:glycosyltransferase involved in cell wall biosynthesis
VKAATPISVITHTRNSARTLPRMLETTGWADERIIIDMSSSDNTATIATNAGCRVITTPPSDTVDAVRNTFLPEAKNIWILVLDSDEYLAEDARDGIEELISHFGRTADAFAIPRFNYIAGQVMRGSQWYPDHQIRLFRKGTVSWHAGHHRVPSLVTGRERLQVLTPPKCLHIHHLNYEDLSAVIERQLRYAMTDVYADNQEGFDFNTYVSEAHAEMYRRFDPENDGDLSVALAAIMAWDRIIRGLIHWDRLGRRPALMPAFTLPVAVQARPRGVLNVWLRARRHVRRIASRVLLRFPRRFQGMVRAALRARF